MIAQPHEFEETHQHLLFEMERMVSKLAASWRSRQNQPEAGDIVRRYQAILRCMIELGHRDSLDADAELPDELLPSEYLDLFKSA